MSHKEQLQGGGPSRRMSHKEQLQGSGPSRRMSHKEQLQGGGPSRHMSHKEQLQGSGPSRRMSQTNQFQFSQSKQEPSGGLFSQCKKQQGGGPSRRMSQTYQFQFSQSKREPSGGLFSQCKKQQGGGPPRGQPGDANSDDPSSSFSAALLRARNAWKTIIKKEKTSHREQGVCGEGRKVVGIADPSLGALGRASTICEGTKNDERGGPDLHTFFGVEGEATQRKADGRADNRVRPQHVKYDSTQHGKEVHGDVGARSSSRGRERSTDAYAAGREEGTRQTGDDDPSKSSSGNVSGRCEVSCGEVVGSGMQTGGSVGGDRLGLSCTDTRFEVPHETGLERVSVQDPPKLGDSRRRILCAGKGVQDVEATDQPTAGEHYGDCRTVHAQRSRREGAGVRGLLSPVREVEARAEEGVPAGFVASLDETRGHTGGGEDRSEEGRLAGAVEACERAGDGAIPADEHTRETEGGSEAAVFAAMIRGLQEDYGDEAHTNIEEWNPPQSGECTGLSPDMMTPPPRQAKLDSFPRTTICVERIRILAEGAGMDTTFTNWMTDPNAIDAVRSGCIPLPGPKSDLPPSFIAACVRAGVCKKVGRNERARGVVKVFTVPKSDPTVHRTIIDGRPINRVTPKPPTFHLISPPQLYHLLKRKGAKWVAKIDLKGFFHQLPIHDEVSLFFCFRIGQTWYRWTRVPMGWSVAPYIAQNTAEALIGTALGVRAVVYLDDILLFGETSATVQTLLTEILERFRFAGAELNFGKSVLKPVCALEYIGIIWHPEQGVFCFPDLWIAKVEHTCDRFASAQSMSVRTIWQMLGIGVRALFVLGTPLCHYDAILGCLSGWSSLIAKGALDWDTVVDIPGELKREVTRLVDDFVRPGCRFSLPEPATEWDSVVWTDACTTGWGAVWQHLEDATARADWGQWNCAATHRHIFLLEAEAAAKGIRAVLHEEKTEKGVLLLVDNKGLAGAIKRGHSKSRLGNFFLRYIFSFVQPHHLRVEWIASEENHTADELSRRKSDSDGTLTVPLCWDRVHEKVGSFGFSE